MMISTVLMPSVSRSGYRLAFFVSLAGGTMLVLLDAGRASLRLRARVLLLSLPGGCRAVHLGSLFALFEGYEKLRHPPHPIESPARVIYLEPDC
jgi:hypothetical protein